MWGKEKDYNWNGHSKGYCSGQQSSIPWAVGIKIPTLEIIQCLNNDSITSLSVLLGVSLPGYILQ